MALDACSGGPAADPSRVYQAHCVAVAVSAAVPYPFAASPVVATSGPLEELATTAAAAAEAESYSSLGRNQSVAVLFAAAVSSAASPTPSVSPLVS